MTPQERDVIAGIFDRLKQAANQPRDPEAEKFIADRLRDQPYAPYAMAQSVYVQEQALANLQAQVEDLQAQMRDLQSQPPAQSGGFLSSIFGGQKEAPRSRSVPAFPQRSEQAPSGAWNNQAGQPGAMQAAPQQGMAGQPQQQPGPWANNQGMQQQPGRAGGGFMATALTTAAGVAGGMMLGSALTNAFSGNKAGEAKAAEPAATTPETAGAQTASDNTNYDDGSSNQANYQDANHQTQDAGYDDGSSFDGGGDDWA